MHSEHWDNVATSLLSIATDGLWSVMTQNFPHKEASVLDKLLLTNAINCNIVLPSILAFLQFMLSLNCNNLAAWPKLDVMVSRYRDLAILYNFMFTSLLTIVFAFSYKFCYVLFHVQSVFASVSLCNSLHTSAVNGETYLGNSVYPGLITVLHLQWWHVH